MKLDSKIWNSLILCSARNDVRNYLNGFYLDYKNGRVASTDGHRLFVVNNVVGCKSDQYENRILMLDNSFKAPANIAFVDVIDLDDYDDKPVRIDYLNKDDELVMSRYGKFVDARYPDIDRVLPSGEDVKDIPSIGVNPQYLADVAKVLNSFGIKVIFNRNDSFTIKFPLYPDVQYVVMAMRVD